MAPLTLISIISTFLLTALATPIVTIPTNQVTYHGISSNAVESFLNIPFGASTAGANRFKSPKPYYPPPHTTINATSPGPACPQRRDPLPDFPLFSNITNMSEDCLNLRIDRPAGTGVDARLPVMVWIYGGGAAIGQIYDQSYIPTGLVLSSVAHDTPVIYAAMNYRVNMFGYAVSGATQKEGSLNSGLLDQRLGLEWIKANIAQFGGDPDNITIFGESEGGTDVGLHITAYGGKGTVPFNKAIMQSGSPAADDGLSSNTTALNFAAVAAAVNCSHGDPDSAATLSCLRALPMERLLDAVVAVGLAFNPFGFGAFAPTVDGVFIPAPPSVLVREGHFHKRIATITGWNSDDASFFTADPSTLTSPGATAAFLQTTFPGLTNSTITQLLELYPVSQFPAPSEWSRASRINRDIGFTCPGLAISRALGSAGAEAYLYELNATLFTPVFEEMGTPYLGVSHFSDIPYVFASVAGYLGNDTSSDFAKANLELAGSVSASWARFATTGAPEEGQGWPAAWCEGEEAVVRVIGGPGDGVKKMQELERRCEFINSPGVMAQVMT